MLLDASSCRWPGRASSPALVLTFAHTLGEFGVVLMVGGNIPGETKTIAISIYDRVQAFDNRARRAMSALLLAAVVRDARHHLCAVQPHRAASLSPLG